MSSRRNKTRQDRPGPTEFFILEACADAGFTSLDQRSTAGCCSWESRSARPRLPVWAWSSWASSSPLSWGCRGRAPSETDRPERPREIKGTRCLSWSRTGV